MSSNRGLESGGLSLNPTENDLTNTSYSWYISLSLFSARSLVGCPTRSRPSLPRLPTIQVSHTLVIRLNWFSRQFCTRKLRRLRTQSTPSADQPLQILLFQAERAWSEAMHMKSQEKIVRRDVVSKFKRAVHFAALLEEESSKTEVSQLTKEDITAYKYRVESWYLLEKSEFLSALEKLDEARWVLVLGWMLISTHL